MVGATSDHYFYDFLFFEKKMLERVLNVYFSSSMKWDFCFKGFSIFVVVYFLREQGLQSKWLDSSLINLIGEAIGVLVVARGGYLIKLF